MKVSRLIFLIIGLILNFGFSIKAKQHSVYNISFTERDYDINTTSGLTLIESTNDDDFYLEDGIGLPVRQIHIAVPANTICTAVNISYDEYTVLSDTITMAEMPKPILMNNQDTLVETTELSRYNGDIENPYVIILNQTDYHEGSIIDFAVSPFIYTEGLKCLGYYKKIIVSVELDSNEQSADSLPISRMAYMLWEKRVLNPEQYKSIFSMDLHSVNTIDEMLTTANQTPVDYLLITRNYLSSAFNQLISWKKTKGLRCEVVTLEAIRKAYQGKTVPEQIKHCIYDYVYNRGTAYVLIGGDESVIPSPKCKVFTEDKMPTDLYYSCFAKQFNWDRNGNGILGEDVDSCSYIPDVAVSRLLVSTTQQASDISNRIIDYEIDPQVNFGMAMMGKHLKEAVPPESECDTHIWAKAIYTNDIKPYWSGNVDFYFDSSTTQVITPTTVNTILNRNYSLVSLSSHGTTSSWSTERAKYYTTNHISEIQREGSPGTIITTIACDTNAFDRCYDSTSSDYGNICLSQAFIQAPRSGVVAYLGCSRSGWYSPGSSRGGVCFDFESKYYKTLFYKPTEFRCFGEVVAELKGIMAPYCSGSVTYRWTQYGLNPIGDPEMPIYLSEPKTISQSGVRIKRMKTLDGTKTLYYLELDESGCTVCITGIYNGENVQLVYNNYRKPYYPISKFPKDFTICITKPGYKPYVWRGSVLENTTNIQDVNLCKAHITSSIVEEGRTYLSVETESFPENEEACLLLSDIMGNSKYTQQITVGKVRMDISTLKSGIYIIALMINGEIADTKRIVIP